MNSIRRLGGIVLLTALLTHSLATLAASRVGSVVFTRGAVSAEGLNKQLRLLGRRAPLYQGDIITTGPKSFAVLSLKDGGRMSLRPDTVFTIKKFSQKKSAASLFMNLFKGGLRMISGIISKRNPKGVRLTASGVTIGIRGTVFDARICKSDCQMEVNASGRRAAGIPVIGRVALLKGRLSANGRSGSKRRMSRGAPIYEGDTLETAANSYAVIAMRDRGRFTLKPGTVFRIDMHRYEPKKKRQSTSLFGSAFSLLKGGVRVLTGLIAKANPRAFRIRTSQATIGIRGTGFDLDDLGPCNSSAPCGLQGTVWLGSISAGNDKDNWVIKLNQNFKIPDRGAALVFIKTPPPFKVPRPDQVDIDFDKLFADIQPGVYLSCHEGHCSMSKGEESTELAGGESAIAPEREVRIIKVGYLQDFQANDPYLNAINKEFVSLYEIFDQTGDNKFACTIQ